MIYYGLQMKTHRLTEFKGHVPGSHGRKRKKQGLLADTDLIFLLVAVSFLLLGVDRGTAICRVSLVSGRLGRFGD